MQLTTEQIDQLFAPAQHGMADLQSELVDHLAMPLKRNGNISKTNI
jgi:hypothetical protein